ncbi:unnamed protein product, partial [Rotaria sp. Silwood1]
SPNTPLSYTSTLIDNQPSITDFQADVPSPLYGVRITITSTEKNEPPKNLKVHIYGCFIPPIEQPPIVGLAPISTIPTSTSMSTGTTTTTGLPPTTTTINYCIEEKGMNQTLYIPLSQVSSNPPPQQITSDGINPTSTTPGVDYPSTIPVINIILEQPTALAFIYIPVNRSINPTNVNEFDVQFFYPNGTNSTIFTSKIPSQSETTTTTTTPSGILSQTTTPSTSRILLPSDMSPQVDLLPNFQVPQQTTIKITITSTDDTSNARGVCKS